MIMQVYHGSYLKIEAIDLDKGKPNKDFGRGFYVTKFRKHAEAWAKIIGSNHKTSGIVTEFKFYERAFEDNTYKTLRFSGYNEQWLDFVVLNRDPSTMAQRHDYDIVEGPVADDKIQNRINNYLREEISKADFLEELKYHEETHQICFCTRNSLQMIEPVDYKANSNIVKISEPLLERLMIEKKLNEFEATDIYYSSKVFTQLADENTSLYLKPWQEIYEILKIELNNN